MSMMEEDSKLLSYCLAVRRHVHHFHDNSLMNGVHFL